MSGQVTRHENMTIKPLEINSKRLTLMKSVTGANYEARTVLTNSAWEYVELWLRRQRSDRAKEALFFWKQAHNFYNASECLPLESRPLTSYYCCMNAAKALLAINGNNTINFDNIAHGISSDRKQWKNNNISNAEVIFTGSGVLFELSKYFCEEACKQSYTIYDLLYNIPCIHRSFSITYGCSELLIPIRDIGFIIDLDLQKGWVQFQIDGRYANVNSLRYAPSRFEKVKYNDDGRYLMRYKKRFDWDIHNSNKKERLENLSKYHGIIRKDLMYIYGNTRLWYLKKEIPDNHHIIKRNSITLIFAAMHWLSELVRYAPKRFKSLMETRQNWLIHEFVDNALYHYIDEISCEIIKADIMTNGYRK